MKNKKGFTLVELLAVIAILAILVLLALPNVLKQFGNAKKSAFETEVKELITQAESDFISDTMFNTTSKTYNSESNPLSLSGNDLEYDINMDTKGNITCIQVSNGSYQFTYSGDGITKSDEITATDKEEDFVPKCEETKFNYPVITYSKDNDDCFDFKDGTIYNYYYYHDNDKSKGMCPITDIYIPSEINNEKVTTIYDYAFTTYFNTYEGSKYDNLVLKTSSSNEYNLIKIGKPTTEGIGITNLYISDGITSIGDYAFQNNNLKSVVLPTTLSELGRAAFEGNEIEYIEIPGSLKEIPNNAFCENKISNLVLNKGIKNIGYESFAYNQLTDINFPEGIESIYQKAFSGNSFIEVNIDNISTFDWESFAGNDILKKITFGSNVDKINSTYEDINEDYPVLEEIEIKTGMKSINEKAFKGLPIKKITLSDGIETIEDSAFASTKLTSITIPSSVTSIGESAFLMTTTLEEVIFKNNSQLSIIENKAFYGTRLKNINLENTKIKSLGESAISFTKLNKIVFPETIKSIQFNNIYTNPFLHTIFLDSSKETTLSDLFNISNINNYYDNNTNSYIYKGTMFKISYNSSQQNNVLDLNSYFDMYYATYGSYDSRFIIKLIQKENYKFYKLYRNSNKLIVDSVEMNVNDSIIYQENAKSGMMVGFVVKDNDNNIIHECNLFQ